MAPRDDDQHVQGGAAGHATHLGHPGLDAPAPPGGPLRQDEPDADVNPVGPVDPGPDRPDPDVQPSSTPDGPATIPSPATPEGEPGPDPGDEHPVQAENAQSSLDQPSDGSGSE